MSEKMSAEEIAKDIHTRLIAMGVDVGDENAIMAGVEALQSEADGLREALTKAAETFRVYARLHRAKDTAEGEEKAKTNERHAEMCEAALTREPNIEPTYQLAIISDGDMPEARMVAIIRRGAGVADWTYVSTAKMLSRYRKWTPLHEKGWHTPLADFGVEASVRGNRLRLERVAASRATYPDGVPRDWQRPLPNETDIRADLLRRVAIACGYVIQKEQA